MSAHQTIDSARLADVTGGYDFARTANAAAATSQRWERKGRDGGAQLLALPGMVFGAFGGAVSGLVYGAGRDAYEQLSGK
jgi:hypothetical protein